MSRGKKKKTKKNYMKSQWWHHEFLTLNYVCWENTRVIWRSKLNMSICIRYYLGISHIGIYQVIAVIITCYKKGTKKTLWKFGNGKLGLNYKKDWLTGRFKHCLRGTLWYIRQPLGMTRYPVMFSYRTRYLPQYISFPG